MILPEKLKESARSMRFRDNTPLYSGMKVIAANTATLNVLVDARFYESKRGVIYCCVWVNHTPYYGRGVGVASGGGYHMTSAALSSALYDMGITLEGEERCSCVGTDAMRYTLMELGRRLINDDVLLVDFHR